MGHVMKDCPSQRAYIVTEDGGYASASDVEDEYALAANHAGDKDEHEMDIDNEEELSANATENYMILIV